MSRMKKYFIILSSILIILITVALLIFVLKVIPEKKEEALLKEQILQYYESKYQQYRLENDKYADYEVDVAFLGDSLTDGYDLSKYYPQFTTANRGIGGETTFGLESRMELSVYELKPKVVVMLIGGNNLNTMFDNYEHILKGLKDNLPNTKIILLSLTNMGQDWGKGNELAAYNNVKIKKLAEKYGFAFVDLYSPLMNLKTGEIYPEYTTDGGHLTEKGYEVLTKQITPVLEEELK